MNSYFSKTSIVVMLFLLSLGLNGFLLRERIPHSGSEKTLQLEYPFLSGRARDNYPNDLLLNFLPLRTNLRTLVQAYGDGFSVYFEYLPTGTSIGINEKQEFASASLLKVPVVMAYYRHREKNPEVVSPVVTITQDEIDTGYGSLWKKGVGTQISLEEAARLALVESDNTAVHVVANNMNDQDFQDVYEGLDIPLKIEDNQAVLTTKQYSSVLKALYFAAVLTKENSNKILNDLSGTPFNDKLVAGIPKGVKVAHKMGVINAELYQDCGIVYLSTRPYLLCMISKSDEKTAQIRMKTVSEMVYAYVNSTGRN